MNTTHYYLEMEFCTQTKNQLQKEAKQYLDSISGKLIQVQDLVELKRIIEIQIKTLNEKYKRCKPIEISYYKIHSGKIVLHGIEAVNFYIKPAEIAHLSQFNK
jgi:hypothetical protein